MDAPTGTGPARRSAHVTSPAGYPTATAPTAPVAPPPTAGRPATDPAGTVSPGIRTHTTDCSCEDCPHGARAAYRRARAEFATHRDRLAECQGVPDGLAHSPDASRQWVSDELTRAAQLVAVRRREAGAAWLAALARHTVIGLWAGTGALLLAQLGTALSAGWSLSRYAGLLAAAVVAGLGTLAARLHRHGGGLLAPLVGEDNRLSTSRAVAAAWTLLGAYTALLLALTLAGTSSATAREQLVEQLSPGGGAGLLTVLALALAAAVWVRHTVTRRVRRFVMQKVPADRPRPADLLTDDAGRASFTDLVYVLVHGVTWVFAVVALTRAPQELPQLPWPLVILSAIATLGYLAAKYTEGGRPVILSVVRAREAGELPSPVRPGDDIEIRGSGFVPAGAQQPDRLAETVVRIGDVYVPVPLVPVAGGFRNPSDGLLTVPVPAEVDSGRVEVRVITAAGTESGRYTITVTD